MTTTATRTAADFAEYQLELMPSSWLRGPFGASWATSFGAVKHKVHVLAAEATKAGIIREAPPDALIHKGRERDLERMPGESDATYAARLEDAWNAYEKSATDLGIIDAIKLLGLTAHIRRDRQWKHDDTVPGTIWARMWIIIVDPPWPFIEDFTALAAKYPTMADWAAAKVGFGVEAPLDTIAQITRIAKKWTSADVLVVNIIVIARGRVMGFPVVADFTALPADTLDSYVAYWDGY